MDEKLFLLRSYDFELPDELIAQYPAQKREDSRLFILDRKNNQYIHDRFANIPKYIDSNDIIVFNDVKVIPARIFCKRGSGGLVELVLTKRIDDYQWEAICNRLKRIKPNEKLYPVKNERIIFEVKNKNQENITIQCNQTLDNELLHTIGELPLPPYIQRPPEKKDYERYQTIYAKEYGAVAAPTAGLHFTDEIIKEIQNKGAMVSFLTLYVSWGTFQPVRVDDIRLHTMHTEEYYLPEETVAYINKAKRNGGRVIAVGTTSLRVLESVYKDGSYTSGRGKTDIFIHPPYNIQSVDALITNFHTPRSTLLMLVAAFAGYDTIMNAYKEAVMQKYRFFSYGDAMFII